MVVIRLARGGRKKYPVYRIVAANKQRSVTSKFLAVLGTYNPHTKDIQLNKEEIQTYLKNGAQASDRVLRLFKANGIELPKWVAIHDRHKKPKVKDEGDEQAKTDKPKEAVAEVASGAANKAEEKATTVDAPETAATEEAVAKEQDKATEAEAKAAEKAEDEAKN